MDNNCIMKKKTNNNENYLERIPVRNSSIVWSKDENGIVTLEIENTGVFNLIAQKIFKKPRVSYVHLDETGSFIWPLIDGNTTILNLAKRLEEAFGEKAQPLYERIAKFFQILASYNFIRFR